MVSSKYGLMDYWIKRRLALSTHPAIHKSIYPILFFGFQRQWTRLHLERADDFHGAGQRTLRIFWLPP
jgi:hypothetical protein